MHQRKDARTASDKMLVYILSRNFIPKPFERRLDTYLLALLLTCVREDVAVELEDVRLEPEFGGVPPLPHTLHDHAPPREARPRGGGTSLVLVVVLLFMTFASGTH